MSEKVLEIQPQQQLDYGIQGLRERYRMLVQAARQILRPGVDYGVIPGTGNKPVLLKPGAEKLAALFGLRPKFKLVDKVEDWEGGFFYYRYKCRLLDRHGNHVADAEGSANSREKRYRWRYISEGQATDEVKARAVRVEERADRRGQKYRVLVVENDEPWDLVNTLQKMAQKRAFVSAVLLATGASEFFTQDLEDLEDEELEAIEVQVEEAGAQPKPEAPKPRRGGGRGPTEFWTRARQLGIPREEALGLIQQYTENGITDWAKALEALEGLHREPAGS